MNVVEQEIIRVYPDAKSERKEALLLKEHSLLIKVNGTAWTSLVCVDTNLVELVAGHLLSCGLIETKDDIARIDFCEFRRKADVFLAKEISWTQKEKSEASCCPKNENFLEAADSLPLKKIKAQPCEPQWVFNLAKAFSNESAIHKWTAGTHSCILAKKGEELFKDYDAVILPVGTGPAKKLDGSKDVLDENTKALEEHLQIGNFGGFPSITIPDGFVNNLPVGVNITGNCYDDANILNIAYAIESTMNYKGQIAKEVK